MAAAFHFPVLVVDTLAIHPKENTLAEEQRGGRPGQTKCWVLKNGTWMRFGMRNLAMRTSWLQALVGHAQDSTVGGWLAGDETSRDQQPRGAATGQVNATTTGNFPQHSSCLRKLGQVYESSS